MIFPVTEGPHNEFLLQVLQELAESFLRRWLLNRSPDTV
jgi:hypothetical protein